MMRKPLMAQQMAPNASEKEHPVEAELDRLLRYALYRRVLQSLVTDRSPYRLSFAHSLTTASVGVLSV